MIFADTNTQGDLISLVGDYNDTIHVGNNDTVFAGGGSDIIYGWDSSDVLIIDQLPSSIGLEGSVLIIENDPSSNTSITGVNSSIDVVFNFEGTEGIAKFADTNLDVSSEEGLFVLFGNSNDNILTGGLTSTTLWGNGGNDTLIGGEGNDAFRYTASDGNVMIQNGSSNDVVNIDYNFSDVSNYEFTDSGLVIAVDDSSLNVIGSDLTTFNFNDGTHIADFSNKTL